MGQPVPYRWISALPKDAQRELERNFAHLADSITPGRATMFDAVLDPEATSNSGLHIYATLTDLVAGESWGTDYLFVIGVVGRPNNPVLQSSAVSLPGPTSFVGMGYHGISGPGGCAIEPVTDWLVIVQFLK